MLIFRGGIFPRIVALFPLIFPLYLLRGEFSGIPVTLPEVILFFMLVYFLIRERVWEKSFWRINGKSFLITPVFLFLAAALLGVLVAPMSSEFLDGTVFPAKMKALGILKGWVIFPVAYFYMARFYFKEKPALMKLAGRALLASAFLLSIYAVYQAVSGNYTTVDFRASGPFESANYLALYVGPVAVYGFFSFFKSENKADKIFVALATLTCFAAIYFTRSYAAWISLFFGLFVGLLVFLNKQSVKVKTFSAFFIAITLSALFVSQVNTDKFEQFTDFDGRSSSSVRMQVYEIAATLIKENPVFGIGLGQFEQFYQVEATRILGETPFEWIMIHPHNLFLALWLNMGILGLIAFVWLLLKALPWVWEKDAKERNIIALMLVVILVHGMFDTPVFKNDLAFQVWLILAMLI